MGSKKFSELLVLEPNRSTGRSPRGSKRPTTAERLNSEQRLMSTSRLKSRASKSGGSMIEMKNAWILETSHAFIPIENLENLEVLKQVEFVYYKQKCEEILQSIYNELFKKHQLFRELRNYISIDQLQKNLIKQVFEKAGKQI